MKRKNNLYKDICNIYNIQTCYNEVCKNTRNPNKVWYLKNYKSVCLSQIHKTLCDKSYVVGPYFHFYIYEPKLRHIVSQRVIDKVINHLVARYILFPALLPCLIDANVASRKNMGTAKGIELANNYYKKSDIRYNEFYILKCDISKFFASINHDILKKKLFKKIKDKDALKIVFDIIDSNGEGLFIGSMTSQILAIFYLNDLDHYVKEVLKIKYYVRYQDDFLLFHPSKEYLKYCLNEIKLFLKKEDLTLNSKTRIYKSTNNFIFLGKNKFGKYSRYRTVGRKLKKKYKLYLKNNISLNSLCSSVINYQSLLKKSKISFKKKQ